MRRKTGYKIHSLVKQYFDDGTETGVLFPVTGSLTTGSFTFTYATSSSSTTSGRFYDCLYNAIDGPGPNSPFFFITSSIVYSTTSSNTGFDNDPSQKAYNDFTRVGGIIPISTIVYASGSLSPVSNKHYATGSYWYKTSGSDGVVEYGKIDNVLFYLYTYPGYTYSIQSAITGSGANGNYSYPYPMASYTAKNGDLVRVVANTSLGSRSITIKKNGTTVFFSNNVGGGTTTASCSLSSNLDIIEVYFYNYNPSNPPF